jgi:hypothetical protein
MKTNRIYIVIAVLFTALCLQKANAQVYFKLSMTEDEKTYIVSMIPEVSLNAPLNIVSTSQITLRLPADQNFIISNLRTTLPNVKWQESYVAERPEEAPGFEYISFGLASLASRSFTFQFGEEVELFRFDNAGDCPGQVSLIDNATDPFIYPNSKSVSISNGITVLGLGTQAYFGNVEKGMVDCASLTNKEVVEEVVILEESISLSPNPTVNSITIKYGNVQQFDNQTLRVFNMDGKQVHDEKISGDTGNHKLELDVRDWNSGSYLMYIENDSGKTKAQRFVKVSAL